MRRLKDKNNLPEKHRIVVDTIRVGKENATLLSDIMSIADIAEARQAYYIIESLINDYGYVIVASRSGEYRGYYIPANEFEFSQATKTFKSEYKSMEARYRNLVSNYNKHYKGKEGA